MCFKKHINGPNTWGRNQSNATTALKTEEGECGSVSDHKSTVHDSVSGTVCFSWDQTLYPKHAFKANGQQTFPNF